MEPSDAELLARTLSDPSAFARFYDRYETAVVGYFMRRVREPELAADLTAEVFANALGAAPRYRPAGTTAVPWLFAIAANTLKSSLRRRRVEARARQRMGIERAIELRDETVRAIEAVGASAQWSDELLSRLPLDQREAVRARILHERSYADIAHELATSELVVRKRVSRGLATMREALEKES